MIYLDHHATTPIDPQALRTLHSCYQELFANPGSTTHEAGRTVASQVEAALDRVAGLLGVKPDEIVITSGATESNNLAILGGCLHPKQKRRKVVSLASEHKAVLDPLKRLEKLGFEVELLAVLKHDNENAGEVDLNQLASAVDENTALVTVMLANNEIGVIQPVEQIADICDRVGAIFHIDAAQAVGRMPIDIAKLGCDLLSFSSHKFYGPKGLGGLIVRREKKRIRLQAQIVGGGQQMGLRSGTLNAPAIIAASVALEQSTVDLLQDPNRIARLRNMLFERLAEELPQLKLNGPSLDGGKRMPGNLNCSFYPVEGQSLMLEVPDVAVSSGSACTSAEQSTSHVLRAIGLAEEQARSSIRFGIGRFTTAEEIECAANQFIEAARKLTRLVG